MIKPFKFWCQKVLPTVYDDALSYYEVLNKVTEKLNEAINQVNSLTESITNLVLNINDELALKADKNNTVLTGSLSMGRDEESEVGISSSAVGYNLIASGIASHAEGNNNTTDANSSHVEGNGNTVHGVSSHCEGTENTIHDAIASHVEGYDNSVIDGANASHVEGSHNTAMGLASHAEGTETIAYGDESHAEGKGTVASSNTQHVEGRYNIEDAQGVYLHILGNGEDDEHRSNAHTVDTEGNGWFGGDVYVGSTGSDDPYHGLLANKNYVENRLATKANKNNPSFTGYGTFSGYVYSENNKKLATESYVNDAVSGATGVTIATGTTTFVNSATGSLILKQIGPVVYVFGEVTVDVPGYLDPDINNYKIAEIADIGLPQNTVTISGTVSTTDPDNFVLKPCELVCAVFQNALHITPWYLVSGYTNVINFTGFYFV